MTEQEVTNLVQAVARRGRVMSRYQAMVFLQAKETLAREPQNALARDVVESFSHFIADGVEVDSFAQFLLPHPQTVEEQAEWRKYAELP